MLQARKAIVESISRNPAILEIPITKPIVIVGLPRTGTTFLSHMLSLDPNCRYFTFAEMHQPTPFPEEKTFKNDPRFKASELNLALASLFDPNYQKNLNELHHLESSSMEEELYFFEHLQASLLNYLLCGDGGYRKFLLNEQKMKYAYQYLRRCMQHSSYLYPPQSHWIIKTPQHLLSLEQLVNEFPDACVIFTHRHPASVICSYFLLMLYSYNLYVSADHDIAKMLAQDICELFHEMLARFVEFRKKCSNSKQFLDLSFEETIQRPKETLTKIYDHFGKSFSSQHFKLVEEYLKQDSREGKSKIGKVSIQDLGFTMEELSQKFEEYLRTYLPENRRK